jgi:hypothetical protein
MLREQPLHQQRQLLSRNTAILRRLANDWFLRCAPPKEIAYMQRFAEDRIQGSC